LDKLITSYPKVQGGQVYMGNKLSELLRNSWDEMKNFGDEYLSVEIMFYTLSTSSDQVGKLLRDAGLDPKN